MKKQSKKIRYIVISFHVNKPRPPKDGIMIVEGEPRCLESSLEIGFIKARQMIRDGEIK
jgi:hypothetical protein